MRKSPISLAQGAFLGAAYGDALGWPQERRDTRGKRNNESKAIRALRPWTRVVGNRFSSFEEEIGAGEYSDDTQLLLAVARSLTADPAMWWRRFAAVELPMWTVYERGGGAATKAAARQWASGTPPWEGGKEPQKSRYFGAGGNGAAMRVIPHVFATSHPGRELVMRIATDAVTTHGHPRAVIGAILYGVAASLLLNGQGTLAYGELLSQLTEAAELWRDVPDLSATWNTWRSAADHVSNGTYERTWGETFEEVIHLLGLCKQAMSMGALSLDRGVLADLGMFGRESGSGTRTAVASIFLMSRHAADPHVGVAIAASATGADTDTLASMTGGLLGILLGDEWIPREEQALIQDTNGLRDMAKRLVEGALSDGSTQQVDRVSESTLRRFRREIPSLHLGDPVRLPDGRQGIVRRDRELRTISGSRQARAIRIDVPGQTLDLIETAPGSAQNVEAPAKVTIRESSRSAAPVVRDPHPSEWENTDGTCPHCNARTSFRRYGSVARFRGRTSGIFVCRNCSGPVYVTDAGGRRIVWPTPTIIPDSIKDSVDSAYVEFERGNFRVAIDLCGGAIRSILLENQVAWVSLASVIDRGSPLSFLKKRWAALEGAAARANERQYATSLLTFADALLDYFYAFPARLRLDSI